MQALVQTGVQLLAVSFEHVAQGDGGLGRRRFLGFGELLFQQLQSLGHSQHGLLSQGLALGGIDFGFDRFFGLLSFDGFGRFDCSSDLLRGFATQAADLVGPHGHGGQSGCGVGLGHRSQSRCGRKTVPNRLQLLARSVQLRGVFQLHAGPDAALRQGLGLVLPLRHIGLQAGLTPQGLGQRFGGQDLNALGQQHRRFALHHDLVLQVLHALDHFGQAMFEARQGFAGQRRSGFGGISLPGQRIGHVQTRRLQQLLGFLGPFGGQGFLAMQALELVEFFLEQFGHALVATRQFAIDLGHQITRRLGEQPIAQAGTALARSRGIENAGRQGIEGGDVKRLGRSHS